MREPSVAGDTSGASKLWREVDAAQWASACAVAYQGLGHLSDAAHYWCTSNRRRVGSAAVKLGLLGGLPEDLAAEARKFYDSIGGVGVMITTIDLEVFDPAGYAKACEVEFESR